MFFQKQRKIFAVLAIICLINLTDFTSAENLRLLTDKSSSAAAASPSATADSGTKKAHVPHNPYSGEHHQ